MHFGGSSTKARKRYVISFVDATNSIVIGGETHTMKVSDLGLGLTFIDDCSNLLVYTTSTGATTQVIPAAPSSDGLRICTNPISAGANVSADITIATSETGQITIIGY